jgi:hypothetical protein
MRRWPTHCLQPQQTDEGEEGYVVSKPAGEGAGGEAETWEGGEDAEGKDVEVVDKVGWGC